MSHEFKKDEHKRKYSCLHKKKKESKYWDGYATFADGRVVYDRDVAEYVKKHLKASDRLDIRKITEAVLYSFSILSGSVEPPKKRNWKF